MTMKNPAILPPFTPRPIDCRKWSSVLLGVVMMAAAVPTAPAQEMPAVVVAEDQAMVPVADKRAQGIMDSLKLTDKDQAARVKRYIVNFILTLKNLHEGKNPPTGEAKKKALVKARDTLYAGLDAEKLSDEQKLVVKNGLSANHYRINTDAFRNLVPTLTDEEKLYIDTQFAEVCDEAVLLNSGSAKGELFVHRRGRINNYLSKRGYDLKKLSQERNERMRKGK